MMTVMRPNWFTVKEKEELKQCWELARHFTSSVDAHPSQRQRRRHRQFSFFKVQQQQQRQRQQIYPQVQSPWAGVHTEQLSLIIIIKSSSSICTATRSFPLSPTTLSTRHITHCRWLWIGAAAVGCCRVQNEAEAFLEQQQTQLIDTACSAQSSSVWSVSAHCLLLFIVLAVSRLFTCSQH